MPSPARPRRTAVSRGATAAISTLLLAGCGGLPFAPRAIPDCPGAIRPADEIPGHFTIREQVSVTSESGNFPFELIAQKRQRELVLVGLSPMGAKLFTVVQTGTRTDVDALPGAVLPIPPLNVLRDLHRLRFAGPEPVWSEFDAVELERKGCDYSIRFETSSVERLP